MASGSRPFHFGSDDVLGSYDDYGAQEFPNGNRSEPSAKNFHESRTGSPLVNAYGQQEEYPKEDVISAVEKCMKKYADNLLRFLEGISGRLSQLELYCYKLERSIGDLRSDMVRDQSEKDLQLKSLEKHLQEVQRSVQILRDKQELDETQKELAKLQLAQKESSGVSHSQKSDEGVSQSASESKRFDNTPGVPNQHLALVPRQVSASLPHTALAPEQNHPYKELPMQQPAPASLNMQHDHYRLNQAGTSYAQRQPLPQDQQCQHLQPELQYMQPRPQIQEQAPLQQQAFPQYQQQWPQPTPQQFPQPVAQPQQPAPLQQTRPLTPSSYPPYPPQQPADPIHETYPSSMPIQVPYSTNPQPGGSRAEAVSFSYGGPGIIASQPPPPPPPQHSVQRQPQPHGSQSSFGPPPSKGGYAGATTYPPQSNVQGYNTMYSSIDGSQGRPQNFQPGSYPPTPSNVSALQNQQLTPSNAIGLHLGSQRMHNNPYGEMIEKAVSMGYLRDHVVSMIHRLGETGQPFDLNALLDRLNARAPSGWSG